MSEERCVTGNHVAMLLLLTICFSVFTMKIAFFSHHDFIMGFDSANYANVADNLARGRGFSIDFILHYFKKYPEVSHPEDRRLSIHSVLIAISFLLFGKTPFAAKLPNIFLGSVSLPITTYFIARSLSLGKIAGFFSALTVMITHNISSHTHEAMADLLFAQCFLLAIFSLIKSERNIKWLYAAGVFTGVSYLAKAQGLLLFPIAFVYYASLKGIRNTIKNKHVFAAMALALILMTPFFVRNYQIFGDPFFSTRNYNAGYDEHFDLKPFVWWEKTFSIYWDSGPPDYLTEFKKNSMQDLAGKTYRQVMQVVHLTGKAFAVLSLLSVYVFWRSRKIRNLWLVILTYVLPIAVFFAFHDRYEVPIVPLMTILLWGCCFELFERIRERMPVPSPLRNAAGRAVITVITGAVFFVCLFYSDAVMFIRDFHKEPYRFQGSLIDVAKWSKQNLPRDSIVMTHDPALFTFFSGLKAVQIPYDNTENIKEVIHHYGVTHLVPWTVSEEVFSREVRKRSRRNIHLMLLDPSLRSNITPIAEAYGLEPLYSNDRLKLYGPEA